MCGILAALLMQGDAEKNRRDILKLSKLLRHRGPDQNSIYQAPDGRAFIAFERLMIVDPTDTGRQPFQIQTPEGNIAWALNSEIYNHQQLREAKLAGVDLHSKSDSAVVGYLYQKYGDSNELWNSLDGIFACVIWDERTGQFCAARDPIGICSLYWGHAEDGSVWFASEMKALQTKCKTVSYFPPGHVYRSSTGKLERWFKPDWISLDHIPTTPVDYPLLKQTFIDAVVKRLMSDAPLAILLSGGLDSSLVASVAVRHIKESTNAFDKDHKLHTYSIGIKGSPDLIAARKVADFLGTIHTEFTFTVEEGIDALYDLIWHIESYEQVRAAVPMYLLSQRIKAMGMKVVLSGEGADEIFGGYLYFHKAPNPEEYHRECVRLVTRLHQWDVLRANKAPFAFGLETRVPFLDKQFLQVAMNIDPRDKMPNLSEKPDGVHPKLEKYILRKAFDDPEQPYLPDEVLFRQKEQFSDGVGYDWVDGLKEYANKVVTDDMWESRFERFPVHPPRTREYYLLRAMFESHFPHPDAIKTVPQGLSIACSTPEALKWDPEWENMHEIRCGGWNERWMVFGTRLHDWSVVGSTSHVYPLCSAAVSPTYFAHTPAYTHPPFPSRSGRAIKAVHEAADGFKLEKAPGDQPAANGVAH
jgi:asparagine synthase (glutamine-hydrolysing)